jgi:hypothetical protein
MNAESEFHQSNYTSKINTARAPAPHPD